MKIPCLWWARRKISSCDYRRHPVCRGYKSGNRCIHGCRCLCRRQADGKSDLARGRRRRYSRNRCYLEKKRRSKVVYLRLRSNAFFSMKSWRIGTERFGGTHLKILRMHLVQNWIRERKRQSGGIIQKGEPHERNLCAPGFEEQPLEENLTTSRLYQQSSVEFGDKICKPNIKLRIILLWRCQRQKIACLLCIRELQCTMLSKEIWA